MRKTRLGVQHMLGGTDTREWTRAATGLLCVGDFGPALEAPPGTRLIGRVLDDGRLWGQGFDMNRHCLREQARPGDLARYFFEFVLRAAVEANPIMTHWLGPNEQVFEWSRELETPGHPQYDALRAAALQHNRQVVMRWYGEFIYQLAQILHTHGKRLVFGNWSVGHPHKDWDLWPHYTRALQAGVDYGSLHASHAYGPLNENSAFRYRWDHREFARLGYPGTQVLLTECGAEDEGGMKPWRVEYAGDVARYFDEWLKPFALALEEDDYVLGAFVFTSGRGGGAAWADYDVSGAGLAGRLADWCASRPPATVYPGDDDMNPEQAVTVMAELDKIDAATAAIRAQVAEFLPPPPWWESWPEGVLIPARKLARPPAPIEMRFPTGAPRGIQRQNAMDAFERRGSLLKVFDPVGDANDWWVRIEDVQPA